ncbi:hypothetical protein FS842_002884 [Serendipita sp. 407]|nr:hypothetical protein FS842_002884 [Serendipita sp. 407]
MSLLLTISCPQLATYSLSLSILNSRHVKRRLDELFSRHPDARRQLVLDDLKERVFQTLRLSQQQPFELDNLGAHDPGLDDAGKAELELRYWKVLQETLKVKLRSFTASLATQFTWALVAFSFTWMDAFGSEKIGTNVTAYGLATSICWSWLMVIVVGWPFAGVSISRRPMTESIERTNQVNSQPPKRVVPYRKRRALSYYALSRRIPGDTERPGPLYNYAKVFVWSHTADRIIDMIHQQVLIVQTTTMTTMMIPIVQELVPIQETKSEIAMVPMTPPLSPLQQVDEKRSTVLGLHTLLAPSTLCDDEEERRTGTVVEQGFAARYLWEAREDDEHGTASSSSSSPSSSAKTLLWKRAVHLRMLWSAVSAIVLNLATVGSAFWLDFLTPSVGLGCRSGGILIYWVTSYLIWTLMVSSAWLSDRWCVHEATERIQNPKGGKSRGYHHRWYALGACAVLLRVLGKTLAVLNSAWILIHSMFEFTRFYNRCYCQTNRGTAIWLFLETVEIRDLYNTRETWFGLAILTGSICMIYITFMGFWTTRRF